eukprot:7075344-Karenia_brevis.AAC.1
MAAVHPHASSALNKNARHRLAAAKQKTIISQLRSRVAELQAELDVHAAAAGHASPVTLNASAEIFVPQHLQDFNSQS